MSEERLHDLDIVQIRNGDMIIVRPKNNNARLFRATADYLHQWRKQNNRRRIDVLLLPYDLDATVLRPDKGDTNVGVEGNGAEGNGVDAPGPNGAVGDDEGA